MQGQAAANMVIVAMSNRVGFETGREHETQFYGGSFVVDSIGAKIVELDKATPSVAVVTFDLDDIARFRKYWGIVRNLRRELYQPIILQTAPAYLAKR